ncbi:ankyrin repeat domain-containing protein [Parashewanella curva]|uniref:Ankyrin repeat domain-containing protein n=2 Tax=Parashewanella curva TaxID=2338552 RepID=A0A3L8PT78_9GAMM|nr:ankyrin repeat domain-containing protein [Parashewanella curva]
MSYVGGVVAKSQVQVQIGDHVKAIYQELTQQVMESRLTPYPTKNDDNFKVTLNNKTFTVRQIRHPYGPYDEAGKQSLYCTDYVVKPDSNYDDPSEFPERHLIQGFFAELREYSDSVAYYDEAGIRRYLNQGLPADFKVPGVYSPFQEAMSLPPEQATAIVAMMFSGNFTPQSRHLCFAVKHRQIQVIDQLLAKNVDINARYKGWSPILHAIKSDEYTACSKGRREDVALHLIEKGANTRIIMEGNVALVHLAAMYNMSKLMAKVLELHPHDAHRAKANGDTPLHMALAYGSDLAIVNQLIAHHANVNLPNSKDQLPLSLAIKSRRTDIVLVLLQAGARVDLEDTISPAKQGKHPKLSKVLRETFPKSQYPALHQLVADKERERLEEDFESDCVLVNETSFGAIGCEEIEEVLGEHEALKQSFVDPVTKKQVAPESKKKTQQKAGDKEALKPSKII